MPERDPTGAWRRYKGGSGPLHHLTERVAKAVHESQHGRRNWEHDREQDQWLAVGSWITAEAVVAVLPVAVVQDRPSWWRRWKT